MKYLMCVDKIVIELRNYHTKISSLHKLFLIKWNIFYSNSDSSTTLRCNAHSSVGNTFPGSSVSASSTFSLSSLLAAIWRGVTPAGPSVSGLNKKFLEPPSTRWPWWSPASSGAYLKSSSTIGLQFLRTALWSKPISDNASSAQELPPASIVPSNKTSRSFLTTEHQSWSMENSMSHLNRIKGKTSEQSDLDLKWLLRRSQPISYKKSKAWVLDFAASILFW